jgi:hypothetical protein
MINTIANGAARLRMPGPTLFHALEELTVDLVTKAELDQQFERCLAQTRAISECKFEQLNRK